MQRVLSWAEIRSAPVVATVAMLVGGLAYVIAWGKLAHHGLWMTPSDLWGIARSSLALAHGHFTGIYFKGVALTSPPGLEVLLAPFAALGGALGFHPIHGNIPGPPYLWGILGPVTILIGSTALFALDAVARQWHFSPAQRLALALVGGLGVANVVVFWGHPEDCIALAFVVWGALAMQRHPGDVRRAAWLFGLAVAFQPLAILALAPVFARAKWRDLPPLALRLVVPSLLVLAPALVASGSHTLSVLLHQPVYPKSVSSTPFSHLAPSIGHGQVAGGPTRLLSLAVAATLGFLVCRRRPGLATVLTMSAVALALRVLLESELTGYYFWPVAALCLLLALRGSLTRFWLCAVAAGTNMVLGNHRVHHIVLWWPAMMATTAAMVLLAAFPARPGPAVECEVMDLPVGSGLGRE